MDRDALLQVFSVHGNSRLVVQSVDEDVCSEGISPKGGAPRGIHSSSLIDERLSSEDANVDLCRLAEGSFHEHVVEGRVRHLRTEQNETRAGRQLEDLGSELER